MENLSIEGATIGSITGSNEMTWFGLDFSNAKLIGSAGFTNPNELKNRYYNSWNNVFVTERVKFDLCMFFKKNKVTYNLSIVESRNKIPDVSSIVINSEYTLEPVKLQEMLLQYTTEHVNPGLGLVFIVESFNKFQNFAAIYVTFFDIKSRQLLKAEKLFGRPRGFGIRNYWMGAIFDILNQIVRKRYGVWKKENC